jgi:hypothetical protein
MKSDAQRLPAVNLKLAFFGAALVDQFIREIKADDEVRQYECAVCTRLDVVYAPDDKFHVQNVRAGLREHVLQEHRVEYDAEVARRTPHDGHEHEMPDETLESKEARGEAFVTREGDFEKYAAMPVPDETFGEFFADAGLTPRTAEQSEPPTTYDCDSCDETSTDLAVMREHVETHHTQVVTDEATRRARESYAPVLHERGKCVLAGSVAPVVEALNNARRFDEYGKQSSDLEFISVEGCDTFGCKLCQTDPTHRQDMTHDSMYGTLTDMRAHLLKAHGEKLAEFIAREVQEKDAEKTADAGTHLSPTDFAAPRPDTHGNHVEDVHLYAAVFPLFGCHLCPAPANTLGSMREHVRAAHHAAYMQEVQHSIEKAKTRAGEPVTSYGSLDAPVEDDEHGSRTEDSHLVKRGLSLSPSSNGVELFDCTLCDDENAFLFPLDLGRKHVAEVHLSKAFGRDWRDRWLEWHFVTGSRGDLLFICRLCDFSTEQLEGRTMTDAREHVRLKHVPDEAHVPSGIKLAVYTFGERGVDRKHIAPVGSVAGLYQCRALDCAPPHEWVGALDRVRQHVEREHDAGLKAAHIENAQAGHIIEPCGFEFKAAQPYAAPVSF